MTSKPDHYIEKCSCGTVISTCRCPNPNKKEIIIPNGCKKCEIAEAYRKSSLPETLKEAFELIDHYAKSRTNH